MADKADRKHSNGKGVLQAQAGQVLEDWEGGSPRDSAAGSLMHAGDGDQNKKGWKLPKHIKQSHYITGKASTTGLILV